MTDSEIYAKLRELAALFPQGTAVTLVARHIYHPGKVWQGRTKGDDCWIGGNDPDTRKALLVALRVAGDAERAARRTHRPQVEQAPPQAAQAPAKAPAGDFLDFNFGRIESDV